MNDHKKIPLIAIVGPTASGKTALSVALSKRLGGEVVSADSMQIYKGMPIASAVPTEEEKAGVPHHLMEFLPFGAEFSVADYVNLAKETINDIYSRGNQPILVGGTGLYVNSLVDNVTFTEEKKDEDLRARLEEKFDSLGGEGMLRELAEFDPESAARLHENNRRRIIRAFEVYLQTGETVTKQNARSKAEPSPYNTLLIGITYRDREKLYSRINQRVDVMLEQGLLDEARGSYGADRKGAGQAIGHKEFFPFFSGEYGLTDAIETLKRETRRYAKRQLTWFGRDERIHWIYADECDNVLDEAMKIIEEGRILEG
jgi:tRNA dimethylallyltransferase